MQLNIIIMTDIYNTKCDIADPVSSTSIRPLKLQGRFLIAKQHLWCLLLMSSTFNKLLKGDKIINSPDYYLIIKMSTLMAGSVNTQFTRIKPKRLVFYIYT